MRKGDVVRIVISEPWDFDSGRGSNELTGTIAGMSDRPAGRPWMLCRVNSFSWRGKDVEWLMIVRRYKEQRLLDELESQARITANLIFSPGELLPTPERVEAILDQPEDLPFLIGGVRVES